MREGWQEGMLMEIGVVQTGSTPTTTEKENKGNFIPFIKPANVNINGLGDIDYDSEGLSEKGLKQGRVILKDSILMVCIGATIGKVGFTNRDVCCNQQINSLTLRNGFYPKFFYYALSTPIFLEQVIEKSSQATLPIINKGKWEKLKVTYPKSLSEQQRIVSILEEAFAAIDQAKANAEKNLRNARELFESYLERAFENNGNEWDEKRIDEVCEIKNGYSFDSKDFAVSNSVKSIKITNVGVKEFIEETDNNLPERHKQVFKNFLVANGSIVIALTRTIISAGLKVAIVPTSYNNALLNQRVAALVPNENKVIQSYLYHFICTESVENYVKKNVNTLMQPNLSINDLKRLLVPIPSLSEQQSIVQKLDALSIETKKLESLYQKKLDSLEELRKSLLDKAFRGELTEREIVV